MTKEFKTCPSCLRHTLYEQRPPTGVQVYPEDVPEAIRQVCRHCGYTVSKRLFD